MTQHLPWTVRALHDSLLTPPRSETAPIRPVHTVETSVQYLARPLQPLRGLTMARIVAMEDAAERGHHADCQWFYHHMERVDVTIQAAIARRLAFVDALDWEIRTVEGADPYLAQDQADLVLARIPPFMKRKEHAHDPQAI